MGFDSVEIPVEDPDLIDAKLLKLALQQNELKPIICAAFGPTRDLTHEDSVVHQHCIDYIEQCFQISAEVGATFVAGPMYSAVGKVRLLPPKERQKEWDLAVKNLRKVCRIAEKYNQQIALEPLNRFESDLVNTSADMVRMVKDIQHLAAGIMLDSFHMSLEELNIKNAIEQAADHLIHMQVSENHRGVPGSGQTRWEDLKAGLENINYKGTVSIESFTPEIKELAGAVCIWRRFADDQDQFAIDGLRFLKELFGQ
jgi:D-psicose/D-tagatose/L-ribulose 3-epimerase